MAQGASFNRGRSKQDYETPWEFIQAVKNRFGDLAFDLAASPENAKAAEFYTEEQNSLDKRWSMHTGLLWLNPPFSGIAPWAEKCATEAQRGARILLLVPASVGSNWFADYVWGEALVMPLRPRLSFDGVNPYPKDCMLCAFGPFTRPGGFAPWAWK